MHISSLIGLLGLASLASGLVISSSTKFGKDTSSKKGWLPPGFHGGHGPVVIPHDKWNQTHANGSSSRSETNITTVVTIGNTTKDVNDTTSNTSLPQLTPGIGGGPGPVIIPEYKWEYIHIHANDSHSWLEAVPIDEYEANRRGRRVSTEKRRAALISKRDGPGDPLPPRDRTLADHMENHGSMFPECYKKCMRQEDGKSSMHMGKDSLGTICGIKWPLFALWSENQLYPCVNGAGGCPNKEDHRVAYRWLKWTCGDKPN